MSDHVFVVSEWLPKKGCEQQVWEFFKNIMALTKQHEKGCVSARATRQITHPGSPSKSKYTIVLMQEYVNVEAFDIHCKADYVINAFKNYIENKDTGIIEEWRCRLFSDKD